MLAIAATTTFVACKKEEVKSNKTTIKDVNVRSNIRTSSWPLDFNAVDIGELHNQTVISLYNGVDFTNLQNAENGINNNFVNLQYDPSTLGISKNQFNQFSFDLIDDLKACNFDLRNCNSSIITSEASYPFIVQILDAIDNITTVNNLNTNLDGIQNQAALSLSQADLDVIIAAIKIAKKSAYLWSPVSMGGLGYYEDIFGPFPPAPTPSGMSDAARNLIKKVLVSDVSALSASFIKLGGMIAVGLEIPAVNVAILVGLAVDAALGSAFGGLLG